VTRLGTIGWIERTGGRLAWQERLALIAQGVRARAAAAMRNRSGRRIRLLEVDDILPVSSVCATSGARCASPTASRKTAITTGSETSRKGHRLRPVSVEGYSDLLERHGELGFSARNRAEENPRWLF
jgi:hypothetical protein